MWNGNISYQRKNFPLGTVLSHCMCLLCPYHNIWIQINASMKINNILDLASGVCIELTQSTEVAPGYVWWGVTLGGFLTHAHSVVNDPWREVVHS